MGHLAFLQDFAVKYSFKLVTSFKGLVSVVIYV